MELEFTTHLLLLLLQDVFGARVKVIDQVISNRDHDYLVLLLKLQHPSMKVVVKLAGPNARMASSFDRTAMIHRLVRAQTTIPVTEIVAFNMSYHAWRFMISTYIPGQEWMGIQKKLTEGLLSDAYRQIGNAVGQLHTIQFPEFGELDADGGIHGEVTYLAALKRRAQNSIRTDYLLDLFSTLLEKHSQDFVDVHQPRLCHEDLHGHNILFQPRQGQWQLAAILDFDKAWAGHHEIDLARLEFWRGMTTPEFWLAYHEMIPENPGYPERRPIYQLLWCLEFAQVSQQHIQDTQELCAQLRIPNFKGFI